MEGPNLITDGQTSWAIQANCCLSNLERGHRVINLAIWTYNRSYFLHPSKIRFDVRSFHSSRHSRLSPIPLNQPPMVISASCTTAEAGASAAPPVQPARRRSASHSPAALYASPAPPLRPAHSASVGASDERLHRRNDEKMGPRVQYLPQKGGKLFSSSSQPVPQE
ncbi:hypothetical protein Acr_00g0043530 [Actinidia rufa]|uniref:Uncharacterized protein n=1 Tax=Actinidia rufa TaxID=165716 RepID=A0A7J0DKE5_9ERIC|nr:hypothetical protein Acr_00g0043530 [Actinidia rufa]